MGTARRLRTSVYLMSKAMKPRCQGMLCENRLEEDRREEAPEHGCPFDEDVHSKMTDCKCCEACTQACIYEI